MNEFAGTLFFSDLVLPGDDGTFSLLVCCGLHRTRRRTRTSWRGRLLKNDFRNIPAGEFGWLFSTWASISRECCVYAFLYYLPPIPILMYSQCAATSLGPQQIAAASPRSILCIICASIRSGLLYSRSVCASHSEPHKTPRGKLS